MTRTRQAARRFYLVGPLRRPGWRGAVASVGKEKGRGACGNRSRRTIAEASHLDVKLMWARYGLWAYINQPTLASTTHRLEPPGVRWANHPLLFFGSGEILVAAEA